MIVKIKRKKFSQQDEWPSLKTRPVIWKSRKSPKTRGNQQGSEERERSPETKEEPRGQHPLIQQEFEEDQREGVGNIFCARENAFSDRPTRFQVE